MPNTIDDKFINRLYAMALGSLRLHTSLLRHISILNTDMNLGSQKFGKVIIPIPARYPDAEDVTASQVPPAGEDTTPELAEVILDNWKSTSFYMTDSEMGQIAAGIIGMQTEEAIDALSRTIIKSILSGFTTVYNHVGLAGTTPLASSTSVATDARRVLNKAGVPMGDRAMLLDFDAEANALNLPIFQRVNESGDGGMVMREGWIGRRTGFDWETEGYLPSFTGGTLSNGTVKRALVNNASVAIGDTSVPIDSGTLTGTLVVGDLFTVAGDTQQYVVTANATAASNAIASMSFSPSAKVAWANNAQIDFVVNHNVAGLALQKQAIAFASRPLVTDIGFTGGNIVRSIPDPHSGLVLTMEVSREYKRTKIDFSCLWGSTFCRPGSAVRVLG